MDSLRFFKSYNNKFNCFKNQNIIVTGATGGIGKVLVQTLIDLEANVIVISRSEKKVFDVFKALVNEKSFYYEIINFEDPNTINKGFSKIMKKFNGKLNSLILCHGLFKVGKMKETLIDQFDSTLNVNVRSCYHLISISSSFLKLTKGNIVVLSSVESKIPSNDTFLNSLSKVIILILF